MHNTQAQAVLLSTRLDLFRLIVGFTHGKLTQRNADYISTDFKDHEELEKHLAHAKLFLRTDNIVFKE